MPQILVSCDKHVKLLFCRFEKFTVVEFMPPHFIRCRDIVSGQCTAQWRRNALVKKDFHTSGGRVLKALGHNEAALCVPQHEFHLIAGNPGEPT
jgi:hypothetical protein